MPRASLSWAAWRCRAGWWYRSWATPDAHVTYAPVKSGDVDLALIKQTTYDPALWQNNAVVKRTPLEDQVMKSFEQKGAFGTMLQ